MADVNDGDVLRLGAGLNLDGIHDVVNVWHVLANHATGTAWAAIVASIQSYMNNLYDDIKGELSVNIGTSLITVANVTQVTTLGAIAWSPTWAGTAAGDNTAAGVCCFAWARTYTPRVQIRKYYGVFSEGDIVDGVWTSGLRGNVELSMAYHIAPQAVTGAWTFTGIAYNRALGTYVFGVSVDSSAEAAYQRRRKRGRGS